MPNAARNKYKFAEFYIYIYIYICICIFSSSIFSKCLLKVRNSNKLQES